MKAKIYLDFNSTHPPNKRALDVARNFYLEHFANSSGLSLESQAVNARIENARAAVASILGVTEKQIVFTSCATESNNLLLRALYEARAGDTFRVLSSPFEHPSVREVLGKLKNTTVAYFPCDRNGAIVLEGIDYSEFDLVVAMAVQNESGVLLPIENLRSVAAGGYPPFLVDYAQALPKLAANARLALQPAFVGALARKNIFITATGHKLGAGFGAGLIVMPHDQADHFGAALLAGGNQEHSMRAGSHNTEAILAFAEALQLKLSDNDFALFERTTATFERMLKDALQAVLPAQIIAESGDRVPGTTLLLLPGIPIDFLIMALDRSGITVSTGTSCKSRSRSPSQAMLAMGYSEAEALSVLRLSYDRHLALADMEYVASALSTAVSHLLKGKSAR